MRVAVPAAGQGHAEDADRGRIEVLIAGDDVFDDRILQRGFVVVDADRPVDGFGLEIIGGAFEAVRFRVRVRGEGRRSVGFAGTVRAVIFPCQMDAVLIGTVRFWFGFVVIDVGRVVNDDFLRERLMERERQFAAGGIERPGVVHACMPILAVVGYAQIARSETGRQGVGHADTAHCVFIAVQRDPPSGRLVVVIGLAGKVGFLDDLLPDVLARFILVAERIVDCVLDAQASFDPIFGGRLVDDLVGSGQVVRELECEAALRVRDDRVVVDGFTTRFGAGVGIDCYALDGEAIFGGRCIDEFLVRPEQVGQVSFCLRDGFFVVVVFHFPGDRLGAAVVGFGGLVERLAASDGNRRLGFDFLEIGAAQADVVAVAGAGGVLDFGLVDEAIGRIDRAEFERESLAEAVVADFQRLRLIDCAVRIHGQLVDFQGTGLEEVLAGCSGVGDDGVLDPAEIFVQIDGPRDCL